MRCKCKVLSVNGIPASDGSIVPLEVMQDYINSQECKEALEKHRMIGSLTHRSRAIAANFPDTAPTLSKTIGKDDSLIIVSDKAPAPTHYIDSLYIEDGWLWCTITLLKEDGMDDIAIQNIRRLKGMLNNGILPGVSAVILGMWDSSTSGTDVLKKLVKLKGIDITTSPAWGAANIEEIIEDENAQETHNFSEVDNSSFDGIRVKTFSDIKSLGVDAPKSSKIDGKFTLLKAKVFSSSNTVCSIDVEAPVEKDFSEVEPKQKEFTMAQVKERLREIKLGPRMYMRRLYMSYKQMVKSLGGVEKMSESDLKILKSLFTSDVLNILNSITADIIKGKQINTLLGLSSLSKTARVEGQKLQIPLRMAHIEAQRQGYVSKMRYTKLQEAYVSFIHGLIDDVFGVNSEPLSPEMEAEMTEAENNKNENE